MSFRLLHTADLHLEAPFVGAGITPRPVARRLARAGFDTLDRVVALALEERVDAVLVAGGLLPPQAHDDTVARVGAALGALDAAGVATVIVGHAGEPLDRLSASQPLPAGVTIVVPGPAQAITVRRGRRIVVEVLAASGLDGLDRLARHPVVGDGPARVALGALPPPRPDDPPFPVLDHSPVAYWALGGRWPPTVAHLTPSGAWVAMAGTPQLHGFTPSWVAVGAVLVEGEPGSATLAAAPVWRSVAAVVPVTVTIPLAEVSELDQLGDRLLRAGDELVGAFPHRLVVARIAVEGVGAARRALIDPGVRARVLDGLRAAEGERRAGGDAAIPESAGDDAEGDEAAVWWAELILAPLPGPAAEPLVRTDRLVGATVRVGSAARAGVPADVMARAWTDLGGQPVGAPPPGPAWAGLVQEATSVVLDLMGGERTCG